MKLIKADITTSKLKVIAHGCNLMGVFNKGVAKSIREKWPSVYKNYMYCYETMEVGDIDSTLVEIDVSVVNMFTQETYGNFGKHATYLGVIKCLERLIELGYGERGPIALPKIGCSLGGLNWQIMSVLLEEFEVKHNVEFWIYSIDTPNEFL